jgi:hypothetical protein
MTDSRHRRAAAGAARKGGSRVNFLERDLVCTGCGIVGADARPNWKERPPQESLTGVQWRS